MPLIFLNIILALGFLILLNVPGDLEGTQNRLVYENQEIQSNNASLQILARKISPEVLRSVLKHQQEVSHNPKESLRTWAQQFHVDLKSITAEGYQIEVSFKSPLDTDVYGWIEDLEKNYFTLLSFGLYRDKVNDGVEGRCLIKINKNGSI